MKPLALAGAALIALAAPAWAQPLPYEPLRKIQVDQLRADYRAFLDGVKFRWFAAGCHIISELDADAPTAPEELSLLRRAGEINYDPRTPGEPDPMKAGWRMAKEPGKCAEYWAAHPDLLRQLLAR